MKRESKRLENASALTPDGTVSRQAPATGIPQQIDP
jgi:hypothetical protein